MAGKGQTAVMARKPKDGLELSIGVVFCDEPDLLLAAASCERTACYSAVQSVPFWLARTIKNHPKLK